MKNTLRPARKMSGKILPSGVIELEEAGFVDGPFTYEDNLEKWLISHFDQLNLDAALIGSQIQFCKGKKADLLAIHRDGRLCIIENKRDCAPREAIAQIIDYSMELNELLPSELDALCRRHSADQKPLKELYYRKFKKELPAMPPLPPLIILLADSFDEDEENTALFLNRNHGFAIRLVRYEAEGHGDAKQVSFHTVINEADRICQCGRLPASAFAVRVEERHLFSWEGMRAKGYIAIESKHAADLIAAIQTVKEVSVLVYLKWAGYVGVGRLKKLVEPDSRETLRDDYTDSKIKRGRPLSLDGIKTKTCFEVEWSITLPREEAYFRSQSSQPGRTVEPFSDPALWQIITSRMDFRSQKASTDT